MDESTLFKKELADVRRNIKSWSDEKKVAYRFAVSSGSFGLVSPVTNGSYGRTKDNGTDGLRKVGSRVSTAKLK